MMNKVNVFPVDGTHKVGVIQMVSGNIITLIVQTGETHFLKEYQMNRNSTAPYRFQIKQIIELLLVTNPESPDSFPQIELTIEKFEDKL